jgi:biopolymer transport protein ExbD
MRRLDRCFFLIAFLIASSGCSESAPKEVRLEVTDTGSIVLEGKPVTEIQLPAQLNIIKENRPAVELHLTASPNASYAQLAPVMKIVQEAGLGRQGFVTASPRSDAPAFEAEASSSAVPR